MKNLIAISVFVGMVFMSATEVNASLVVLENNGALQLNVLSAESDILITSPDHGDLQIDKLGDKRVSDASIVKLVKNDEGVSLDIYGKSGINSLDVSNYKESVLEISERPEVQKLELLVLGDKFGLKNKNILAITNLPITVDSDSATLSFDTGGGSESLHIYPFDAVQTALRTKFLSRVGGNIEILYNDNSLEYKIDGVKIINIFNLYDYSIPISSYISATTGEVVKIDAPSWLKFINLLFA